MIEIIGDVTPVGARLLTTGFVLCGGALTMA